MVAFVGGGGESNTYKKKFNVATYILNRSRDVFMGNHSFANAPTQVKYVFSKIRPLGDSFIELRCPCVC